MPDAPTPDTTTVVPGDQTSGGLSHRQVLVILSGLMLGMLLAALDQTIVATALPTIVGDLHGLNHLSWVVTAYLLTTTLSTPLYGKISDLYGRKTIFQVAIVIFLVGSALSGLSANMDQLIVFRAVQGLGGGGLMALAMAIVGDIVSPRERGRYQGYFGAVFVVASIGGPLAGGFFTDHLTWRWIFYINLPVGILALLITSAVLRLPRPQPQRGVDLLGATLVVAAVTPLILVTVWGGTTYAWSSGTIVGLVAGSLVMIGAVLWWERRAPQPIFPPRVFAQPVVRVAVAMTFFVTASMFAVIIYLPVYLQLVDGVSATRSGVLLLPLMAGMLTTSIASGRLVTRLGRYRVFPIVGTALMSVGMWLFTHLGAHTSFAVTSAYMVVFGVGMGMTLQIVVVAVQNAVERRDLGSATSSISFFRNIGAACGTALLGAVLAARLGYWLPRLVPAHSGLNLSQSFTITPQALHALPPAVHAGVTESFVRSLHLVFLVGVPLAVVALACALGLRELPLRDSLRAVETHQHGAQPRPAPSAPVAVVDPVAERLSDPVGTTAADPGGQPVAGGGQAAPGG
ncbi:MAG TPA: MDR family MFS transporter [Acidimicrobiales bacterium]|nr:MDR family MFS transporter [Acidimicrobiales bacterium]